MQEVTESPLANDALTFDPENPKVMTRSVSITDFNEVIDNCAALAFPSPSPSEDELSVERERKAKEVKRKRQILAFVIICLLVVGGVIVEKIKF
jgi:hypothetical protein